MLTIRFQRIGRKKQPSYRLVVAEKRSKMGAPPVEDIGSYNPFTKELTVNAERVSHWLKAGAQPTATVHNLLVKKQVVTGSKIKIAIKRKPALEAAPTQTAAAPAPSETAAQAAEVAPTEAAAS